MGVYVRDRVSGVGTVTFYDPETGLYGALGHGVREGEELMPMVGGEAGAAEIWFFQSHRCVAKISGDGEKKVSRWQRIA